MQQITATGLTQYLLRLELIQQLFLMLISIWISIGQKGSIPYISIMIEVMISGMIIMNIYGILVMVHHLLQRSRLNMYIINIEKCTGCAVCMNACSVGAIYLVDNKANIDQFQCKDCGACAQVCPVNAISFNQIEMQKPLPVNRKTQRKKRERPRKGFEMRCANLCSLFAGGHSSLVLRPDDLLSDPTVEIELKCQELGLLCIGE